MQIVRAASVLDITNRMIAAETTPGNSPLYDALMRVRPADLSLNAWTVKAGVGRSIFTEIRRHGNPTAETLRKLLAAIDLDHAQFEASRQLVQTEVKSAGIADVRTARYGIKALPRLRLLGSAIGGQYVEGGVDLIELHLGEVLDYLTRPASLEGDPRAYALTVISDSMAPRFEPGERIAVSPKAAVSVGDDVIVQLRGEGEDQEADRIVQVLVKRLVRRSASYVELRQFNPDSSFQVPAARIASIHKVAGRLF